MKIYAFDIEVFRNLFTATFVNVEDDNDIFTFYAGIDNIDYSPLIRFLKQRMVLVGYNSDSYDNPMLRYIQANSMEGLTAKLFELSGKLIDDNYRSDREIKKYRYALKKYDNWKTIDLMRILAFDRMGISLKQTAINLKWHKIQDIPLDPLKSVKKEDIPLIMEYNLNDVLITKKLYEEIEPLRKLRTDLGKIYNADLSSASDSAIANILLEKIYAQELNADMEKVKAMRTPREKVQLKDCIASFVSFETPQMNDILATVSSRYVYSHVNYRYSEKFSYGGCNYVIGIGGLHSEDTAGEFISDDEFLIQDMDVASYYPNLIINNNFYPEHLGPDFIKVLKRLTAERLDAKHKGDKTKADGLKITINSIFGKFGSDTFWLYDPKQLLSTTVSGQLGLLMLIEKLYLAGINTISANTDGVVCKIPRKLLDDYYRIAKEWEEATGLELEFTPYKKYIRRDVNSYITEKEDGSSKEKGAFLTSIDLKKSYKMPIVPKAIYEYFINDVPVMETLSQCKDIMQFCISEKTGKQFAVEFHTLNGIEPLQRTNRFYISTKGGTIVKRSITSGKMIGLFVGNTMQILNDYDESKPFDAYDVDLLFYEREANKFIDEIRPKQMSLFDHEEIGYGEIPQMEYTPSENVGEEELVINIEYLNKLGKNQLIKKIEEIVQTESSLPFVDSLYAYVQDISPQTMEVKLYALRNGEETVVKLDRAFYKNNRIFPGLLIFCDKFRKEKGEYVLEKYTITDSLQVAETGLF